MKKIAFVIEQLSGGGAERVTAALANELCRMGTCEIHLVVYKRVREEDYPVLPGIHWHILPELPGKRFAAILERWNFLKRTIEGTDPDCVVSLGMPRTTVLLVCAMLGSGIPLVLSERNDPSRYPVTSMWRFLRTCSYFAADRIVFQTGQARDYFPAAIRQKGTVICNPITGNLPEPFSGAREKRIVNFCRLSPQKNLSLLVDAFSDVCQHFPEYTLCIYGEGTERQHLEEKIKLLGLENKVLLPGHSHNIYEEIRKAALFVSSSDYEGISNSMLEAMALGVPTICTDCPAGGARETIRNGENGLLVPVGDRQALAAAIGQVLSDDILAQSLSNESRKLREQLSAATVAQKWLEVIEKAAG